MRGGTIMTIQDAIDLFSSEMKNEIYNNVSDESLQSVLLDAVEDAASMVMKTYQAEAE